LLQVKHANPTSNPSEQDLMRVSVGLFNKAITLSDMYDVIKNKVYNIGKQFIFMNCYEGRERRTCWSSAVPPTRVKGRQARSPTSICG
jgi:hypothetical protein